MATIDVCEITLDVSVQGAVASLRSVVDVLEATGGPSDAVAKSFPDLLDALDGGRVGDLLSERVVLLFGEPVTQSTGRALECIIHPADRYVEFVAAIARDGNVSIDPDFHGWPVLSLVGPTASVAEAGAVTSRSGGRAEELELPRKQNLPDLLSAGYCPDLDGPTTENAPGPAAGETGEAGFVQSSAFPVERQSAEKSA